MKGIEFYSKSGNKYFYDDVTGHIFNINDDEDIKIIQKLHNDLKITDRDITKEEFNSETIKEYLYGMGEGFKQLILEVTTACNFRCKYCTYSDYYETTRAHGNELMTCDIAKKAIDYYFENFKLIKKRNPEREPVVSFYGGEPLLNYGLIKLCVEYIRNKYQKYSQEVSYSITTNGYLLTDEIQDFLYENKFSVLVSIDGYKENHDRNRLTIGGKKTFDRVFSNYNKIREKYPQMGLSVSCCMDYKTDIEKLMNFSNNNDIDVGMMTLVEPNTGSYYKQFSEQDRQFYLLHSSEFKKKLFETTKKQKLSKNKFMVNYISRGYKDIAFHPKFGNERPLFVPYTGTCVMGEKVYVDVKGDFFPCEKVGCKFSFGNIYTGIDFEKIACMYKKYRNITSEKCKHCNITKLCSLCLKDLDIDLTLYKNKNMDICKAHLNEKKCMLEDFVTLKELFPPIFDADTANYYEKINARGN